MDEQNDQVNEFSKKTDVFFKDFEKIKNFQTKIIWFFGGTYLILIAILAVILFFSFEQTGKDQSNGKPNNTLGIQSKDSLPIGDSDTTSITGYSDIYYFYNINSSRATGKFSKKEALNFICDSSAFFEKGETAILKLKNGNIMGEKGKMLNFTTLKDIWEKMRQKNNYSVELSINIDNKKVITRDVFSDEMQILKEVTSFKTESNFILMEMRFNAIGTPIKIGENTMRLLKTLIGE